MFKQIYSSNPHRPHPSTSILAVVLFLLAVLPVPTASGSTDINKPPPLPGNQWIGKTNLNYDGLHNDFVDVLVCLYIPVGVLGTYMWFSSVLMVLFSICQAIRDSPKKKSGHSIRGKIIGVLTLIPSIFFLYQNAKTVEDCSHLPRFGVVHGAAVVGLVGSGFSAAGSAFQIYEPTAAIVSVPLFVLSLVLQYVAGPVYYSSVVKSEGISRLPTNWDRVRLKASIAATLPFGAVELFLVIAAFVVAFKWDKSHLFKIAAFVLVIALGQLIAITFLFNSLGNVLLGKIVGDPWGKYILKKWVGVISAIFTSATPVVEGILVFWPCG